MNDFTLLLRDKGLREIILRFDDSIMATMKELQNEVVQYLEVKGKNWTNADNHYFRRTYLIEEVGEPARSIINIEAKVEEPNRRGLNQSREAKLGQEKDALGDILYHVFGMSSA